MALVAKRQNTRPVEMIVVEGLEITDKSIRATAHRILVEKRCALGMVPVDLTHLVEGGRTGG
jgi:hypothetical protein